MTERVQRHHVATLIHERHPVAWWTQNRVPRVQTLRETTLDFRGMQPVRKSSHYST